VAVQLQQIGLQGFNNTFQRRIVGIDRERHLQRTLLYRLAEVARRLKGKMARRRRKEHEPDHVRASIQRDVERLARGQAANLDDQGHGFKGNG